jgi:ABC-type amino acid transport substrate-binding protein
MRFWCGGGVLLACLLAATLAAAQAPATERTLVVGVVDSPPLAIPQADGSWSGLTVDLWARIAGERGWHFELKPIPLGDVAQALHDGTLDAALGAVAVTPEGEAQHDFSQPYLATGLGFAQRMTDTLHWDVLWQTLLSTRLLSVVAAIVIGVLLVGLVIALVERRQNATDFGGSLSHGVSTGVWWAAVTMTTVGYGDATPKTAPGRALALLWMFVGVGAVAILTATVTSILTLSHLRGTVQHPADLLRLRLGAVPGGAGAEYLTDRHAPFVSYASYEAGLAALHDGEIQAFVANIPTLRFLVTNQWHAQLEVSPIALEAVLYAIALPDDSPLREPIDAVLVRIVHEDSWRDSERRYLGPTYAGAAPAAHMAPLAALADAHREPGLFMGSRRESAERVPGRAKRSDDRRRHTRQSVEERGASTARDGARSALAVANS